MPSITIHPPNPKEPPKFPGSTNPLPGLLKTPSGLAMVEIQGSLNMPSNLAADSASASEESALDIGRLVFPDHHPDNPPDDLSWSKRVYLYVGKHQRLTGEVKKLPNPLAVVRGVAARGQQEEDFDMTGNGRTQEELEIVELVKWRILFSQRPEPVGI